MSYGVCLHIFGEFACFTRPEFKAKGIRHDLKTVTEIHDLIEAIY